MSPVLSVENLRVRFDTQHGAVQAVDLVSFVIEEGETLGLVGESGSGKTVTCLALMGLLERPAVVESGRALFGGRDLLHLPEKQLRALRGKELSMIFQDPMTSLNPFLTIGRQLTEVLEVHRVAKGNAARSAAARALGDVGLSSPEARLDQYPHELSGGMRQRVVIAMALLCNPKVVFADEPTTALDVTIQAQILDLLRDLQRDHGTAIVLITHDLGVIAGLADRVQVMYAGRLVEASDTERLFDLPLHPYTLGLLRSVPTLATDHTRPLTAIDGQPPDLTALPEGCAFRPRCPLAVERCAVDRPALLLPSKGTALRTREGSARRGAQPDPVNVGGRRVACHEVQRAVDEAQAFALEREGLRARLVEETRARRVPAREEVDP